jgi:PAS domain-containing protein
MAEYTSQWLSQQIVDNAADAIIFGDKHGIVRLWNAGAETMFGFHLTPGFQPGSFLRGSFRF